MQSWIKELEERDEPLRVGKPVDPRGEMGALLYQSREKGLLFEKLRGFRDGGRWERPRPICATPRLPSALLWRSSCPLGKILLKAF